MQHDPYDQFASGYVGMGNDPANGTDPSGGLFGVGGSGCAAAAGMSGYGGYAGRIAGGLNMGGVLSTTVAMGGIAINGAGMVNNISNIGNSSGASGSQGLSQSSYSGASGPNAGSWEDDGGGSESDCKCPPGYGPNPKGGKNPRPFYTGKNAAATFWAVENKNKVYEHSSLLYEVSSRDGTLLYSTTAPSRFEDDATALVSSPGLVILMEIYKNKIPKKAVIGHIHLHPTTSTRKHPSNIRFSKFDDDDYDKPEIYQILSQYRLWVLGLDKPEHTDPL